MIDLTCYYDGPLFAHSGYLGNIKMQFIVSIDASAFDPMEVPTAVMYNKARVKAAAVFASSAKGINYRSVVLSKGAKYWSTEQLTECGVPVRYCNCSCDDRCQFVVKDKKPVDRLVSCYFSDGCKLSVREWYHKIGGEIGYDVTDATMDAWTREDVYFAIREMDMLSGS